MGKQCGFHKCRGVGRWEGKLVFLRGKKGFKLSAFLDYFKFSDSFP